jgi:vancomycin permeability regulator SanA
VRKKIAWLAAAGVAMLFIGSTIWEYTSSSAERYTVGDPDVPERSVAIVLGAGVRDDGLPSRMLSNRLDAAVDLYEQGRVRAVLVTGDNGTENYNETDVMRDYLIDAGVDRGHVVGDYAGFRTWDSCVRAREIFGVEDALVVTQAFHIPRAVTLCRRVGIEASGVGDPSFGDRPGGTVQGYIREVLAAPRALFDAAFQPDPRFLGEYEHALDDALADANDAADAAED